MSYRVIGNVHNRRVTDETYTDIWEAFDEVDRLSRIIKVKTPEILVRRFVIKKDVDIYFGSVYNNVTMMRM